MALELKQWDVTDYLNTEEDMQLYLAASVEDDDGDGALIRLALSNIARARGMSSLAKEVGVSREGLYKALSAKGNPSFSLMLKVTRALGFDFKPVPHG